ncbi:cysteine hydrolase family protein [Enteractinococcus coprophilus]|uniref:Nicotinamidase-related amidase n=1 Tax=Enteractinococcus coprophilus TaxID=1027633 RepID=A0A543AMT5_9MICC|nr:cysteine hydrolase [Enteractinococcus coprophilus]TQL73865.1 nicotinamidase-related amidase [Enteractinococcus coprophilus]
MSKNFEDSLLVIIDMQRAFQLPEAQWECVGYDAAAENIRQLRKNHPGPAVWTQFIRDPAEDGAWAPYYDRWDQYRIEPTDALWQLTMEPASDDICIQASTFGKWPGQLADLAQPYASLTIVGVATDCCVLSTVLPAIDAGKHVTVVADACAGATEEAHEDTLELLRLLEPMVSVTTTQSALNHTPAA